MEIKERKSQVVQEDPVGEFEWGMERLERALRDFSPGLSDGMVTRRKMNHELFPPSSQKLAYTAQVTISSETTILHGRRSPKKIETADKSIDEKSEIQDPLADKTEELNKLIEFPGAGPRAPAAAQASIEPRSLERITVFEMAYVEGHWKLTKEPELKHERSWFKYAFD